MDFWKSQDGTKRMEILCIFFDIKMVDVGVVGVECAWWMNGEEI